MENRLCPFILTNKTETKKKESTAANKFDWIPPSLLSYFALATFISFQKCVYVQRVL